MTGRKRRSRSALYTTDTDDNAIAAAAMEAMMEGLSEEELGAVVKETEAELAKARDALERKRTTPATSSQPPAKPAAVSQPSSLAEPIAAGSAVGAAPVDTSKAVTELVAWATESPVGKGLLLLAAASPAMIVGRVAVRALRSR